MTDDHKRHNRYVRFARPDWAPLRAATPLTLDERDLEELSGINEEVDLEEVIEVYLPLSRLLNLHVSAAQDLFRATDTFLGQPAGKVPYVIGIAGSVAVGKSTTARILAALLRRWPDHPRVELVTTDGFLYPNSVLESRKLMSRKGFPESYDAAGLLDFLAELKSGAPEPTMPVYSHEHYDIVDGLTKTVAAADIVIVEGLNVLQVGDGYGGGRLFVSDFFDFSIYVDAVETDIEQWYVERFLTLAATRFQHADAYFHRYASVSTEKLVAVAKAIWRDINGVNLRLNIEPTRERADLILEKGPDHRVASVRLAKL